MTNGISLLILRGSEAHLKHWKTYTRIQDQDNVRPWYQIKHPFSFCSIFLLRGVCRGHDTQGGSLSINDQTLTNTKQDHHYHCFLDNTMSVLYWTDHYSLTPKKTQKICTKSKPPVFLGQIIKVFLALSLLKTSKLDPKKARNTQQIRTAPFLIPKPQRSAQMRNQTAESLVLTVPDKSWTLSTYSRACLLPSASTSIASSIAARKQESGHQEGARDGHWRRRRSEEKRVAALGLPRSPPLPSPPWKREAGGLMLLGSFGTRWSDFSTATPFRFVPEQVQVSKLFQDTIDISSLPNFPLLFLDQFVVSFTRTMEYIYTHTRRNCLYNI